MKKIAILILLLTLSINAFAVAGDPTNQNGTGDATNQNGIGDSTNFYDPQVDPNAYNPNVDPNEYGDSKAVSKPVSGFNPNSVNDPFKSSSNGVPKLSLMGIVAWLVGIMNQLVYVIVGAALVSFLYGILKLSFIDGQKPEAREQARKFMFWGIVSLFVMMSVWGLVQIFKLTLFGSSPLIIPSLK